MKTHYTVRVRSALPPSSSCPGQTGGQVAEIDVINAAPYDKEYVPPAAKAIADGGGKYIVRGGETTSFYGDPPKSRIAIMLFESMDKAKAAFDSPAFKAAKAIGDKYAKFRVYAVEGLPQ